ncbi:MAG: SH3 domain-containing protein [Clostridia bacterium]|nr:SH3 domain-containing protein [Clostridia bacterium]
MKLRYFLILFLASLCITGVNAETNKVAYVNASTSDRVHLRAGKSTSSDSMGLYFTGTPVFLPHYSSDNEWTYVVIGAEKGYIKSDLLTSADNNPPSQLKQATVTASGSVNLRSAPTTEAPILERVPEGANIVILGETVQKWYYVKYGSTYGYITSQYIRIGNRTADDAARPLSGVPFPLPKDLYYSSGVGAWSSQMTILPDGRFWGYYHDSDMGDAGIGYPRGTEYECSFTGVFTNIRRISEYEYQMQVQNLQCFGIPGQRKIEDGVLIITSESVGLMPDEIFSFYFSSVPENYLSEHTLIWRNGYSYNNAAPDILYGHTGESVWLVE